MTKKILWMVLAGFLWATSANAAFWDDSGEKWDEVGGVWDSMSAMNTPTRTRTPTFTPTPSPTFAAPACCGDVDGDGYVEDTEYGPANAICNLCITEYTVPDCYACDCNADYAVFGNELVLISVNKMDGCPGFPARTHTFTPTSTPTPTNAPTNTKTPTAVAGCRYQTHETMPSQNASFTRDVQEFLCLEDAWRSGEQLNDFVVSGGELNGIIGDTVYLTPLTAYAGGSFFRETANAALETPVNDTVCYFAAGRETTGNVGVFSRVSGKHYVVYCGASRPVLPDGFVWVIQVTTNSSATVTATVDLRNRQAWHGTVRDALELATVPSPVPGQVARNIADGLFYVYVSYEATDAGVPVVSGWTALADARTGVLVSGNQTVAGVKSFTSFPKKSGSLVPSNDAELVPKQYVDSLIASEYTSAVSETVIQPAQRAVFEIDAEVSGVACTGAYEVASGSLPAGLLWSHTVDAGVVKATAYNVSGEAITLPAGTLREKCL